MTSRPLSGAVGIRRRDLLVAAVLVLLAVLLVWSVPARDALGRPLPLAALFGLAFGVVLQRSRFCFWCNLNDFLTERDPRGLIAILVALAAGTAAYTAVIHGWVADPFAGRLPPDAFIGPVGVPLVLGALAFGIGMVLSGSCVSAHLYRLGEGSIGSVLVLFCVLIGFVLGFLSWNWLFLTFGAGPVIWLPALLGHGGALALALAALALLSGLLLWRGHAPVPPLTGPFAAIFRARWPAVIGGLLVALIAVLSYLRVAPLGVTAEIGSIARTAASDMGWLPERLLALDTLRGCVAVVKETLASRNGVFILGIILGAAASARMAGQWQPVWPKARDLPRLALGGLLLGFGAMIALGCTVGALMSGIMAGSASGWVFAAVCVIGAILGKKLRAVLP